MTPNQTATLSTLVTFLEWAGFVPFFLAVHARARFVKGTRQWHALNLIVTVIRPTIRPATACWTAFRLILHATHYDGWGRAALLAMDLLTCAAWWWWIAVDGKDDDSGDPWGGLGRRIKNALTAHGPAVAPAKG